MEKCDIKANEDKRRLNESYIKSNSTGYIAMNNGLNTRRHFVVAPNSLVEFKMKR